MGLFMLFVCDLVLSASSFRSTSSLGRLLHEHPASIGVIVSLVGAVIALGAANYLSKHRRLVGTVVPLKGAVVDVEYQALTVEPPHRMHRFRIVEVELPNGSSRRIKDDDPENGKAASVGQAVDLLYDSEADFVGFASEDVNAKRRSGWQRAGVGLLLIAAGAAFAVAETVLR